MIAVMDADVILVGEHFLPLPFEPPRLRLDGIFKREDLAASPDFLVVL
jgi:hypothetical protein